MPQRRPYEDTTVSWTQSQATLASLFAKHEIISTRFTNYAGQAIVEFMLPKKQWPVRLTVAVAAQGSKAADARELNRIWRCVFWFIKSKLEAVEIGLTEMEREWLPYIAIGDGTFSDRVLPEMNRLRAGSSFAGLLLPGRNEGADYEADDAGA